MKVLVTGGAGFIGSNVVDAVLDAGHDVAIIDNLSTGLRENINPKATFYEMSICDRAIKDVFEKERPDIVDHHAAQMDVRKSVEDPMFDAGENILGSLNIIMNSLKHDVKKIVYASTGGAVYGEAEYLPADENHPVNPMCQYGVSKHTVEHYLYLYSRLYGLPYVALRYPNVYGPRQNPQGEAGVVAIFTGQLLNNEQPVIFGDGSKTRDYTYVGDIVAANLLAIEKGNNKIYNIGTGIGTSDQQVYDTIANALNSPVRPAYEPVRKGEIHHIALAADLAKKELGWEPMIAFKEGIDKTVKYFVDRLERTKGDSNG